MPKKAAKKAAKKKTSVRRAVKTVKPSPKAKSAKALAKKPVPKAKTPKPAPAAVSDSDGKLTFNHAMIYVKDVARALGFYRDLLGFKLIEDFRYDGRPSMPAFALPEETAPSPSTRRAPVRLSPATACACTSRFAISTTSAASSSSVASTSPKCPA